jgi:cell fate (sporulation/competence/biofilm development) regulator YmcA (YheA/YmcA/DUF963 family)
MGLSSRRGLTELQQLQVLNEILDDNVVGEHRSDEEDYTQLLRQTTHEIGDNVNTEVMVIVILKDNREGCQ